MPTNTLRQMFPFARKIEVSYLSYYFLARSSIIRSRIISTPIRSHTQMGRKETRSQRKSGINNTDHRPAFRSRMFFIGFSSLLFPVYYKLQAVVQRHITTTTLGERKRIALVVVGASYIVFTLIYSVIIFSID